jgi:hypothetical protein
MFHYKKSLARYDQKFVLVFTLGTVVTFYLELYIILEIDNVIKYNTSLSILSVA